MSHVLFIVVARAANGVIGANGTLPWHLPADLRRFKALTMGKPMIMGRKTFELLPGLLPGRRHIVLTRDGGWSAPGADRAGGFDAAIALAGDGEIAVIGGAEIFSLALDHAQTRRVELTEIHADYVGDAVMPAIGSDWLETFREEHPTQEGRPPFAFVTLKRAL